MYGKKKSDSGNKKNKLGRIFSGVSRESAFEKRGDVSELMSHSERMRHIAIVCEQLREQYKKHEGAQNFIKYLGLVEDIFIRVRQKNWSIERTREEMIGQAIQDIDDLEPEFLAEILHQYDQMFGDVLKIREAEDFLLDKYEQSDTDEYAQFIRYITEYYLIFSNALTNDLSLEETKRVVIETRIKIIAQKGEVSEKILQEIYREFLRVLENYDIYIDPKSI